MDTIVCTMQNPNAELNNWFIEKNKNVQSCLYLIDTGLCDGKDTIFKFGRTTDVPKRMSRHMQTWKNMRIVHIEPVIDSVNCEKQFKTMAQGYVYSNTFIKQKELISCTTPKVFIDGLIQIAQNELEQLKVYQEQVRQRNEFREKCTYTSEYKVSEEYIKNMDQLLNASTSVVKSQYFEG